MVNWHVRFKNKAFWLSFIPAVLLLIQVAADLFGCHLELSGLSDQLLKVVNALFAVLMLLGVVNDPTTKGITDSERAMTYQEPK